MEINKNKEIGITVCIHGNEQYGLKIKNYLCKDFNFIIGNKKAIKNNLRFIDKDLNRSFPGNKNSIYYEERRAFKLSKKVKNYKKILDLHSTSEKMPLTGIISEPYLDKIDFILSMGLKKLVLIPDFVDDGVTLDKYHNCCICIEVGPHNDNQIVKETVSLIKNIDKDRKKYLGEVYEVFQIINKPINSISLVENYLFVQEGTPIMKLANGKFIYAKFDFYPILANEKSYNGILCFAAKKISFNFYNN